MSLNSSCYCCSGAPFEQCCAPLLNAQRPAPNAEALMRSRYTAFCLNNAQYIYDTYGEAQRQSMTVADIQQSCQQTAWLGLKVLEVNTLGEREAEVEFCAWSAEHNRIYLLHERSQFEKQNDHWRYTTGDILPDSGMVKIARNDPCVCQSGKKFKKCCLTRLSL